MLLLLVLSLCLTQVSAAVVQCSCQLQPPVTEHNKYCAADFVFVALIGEFYNDHYAIDIKNGGPCMNELMPSYFKDQQHEKKGPPHGSHGNAANNKDKHIRDKGEKPKGSGKPGLKGLEPEVVDKTKIYVDPSCPPQLISGTKYILSGSIEDGKMVIQQCTSIVIQCKKKQKLTINQEENLIQDYRINCNCKVDLFQYDPSEIAETCGDNCCAVGMLEYQCHEMGSKCQYHEDLDKCISADLKIGEGEESLFNECAIQSDLPHIDPFH